MKQFYRLSLMLAALLVSSFSLFAQAPQQINYQAVARDLSGAPLVGTAITVVYDIRQSTPTGTVVYSETHSTSTNQFGLFNLAIGSGTPTIGTFPSIAWGSGLYYLQVTIDGDVMPATQLLSVPYALHANTASTGVPGADGNDNLSIVTAEPLGLNCANGGNKVEVGVDDNNDGTLQPLEIDFTYYVCDGLDGASNVSDTSATNELQTLSISNDTIFLTNGGFVQLPSAIVDADWQITGNDLFSIPTGNVAIGATSATEKLTVASTDSVITSFTGSNPDGAVIAVTATNSGAFVGSLFMSGSDTAIIGLDPTEKTLFMNNTTPGGNTILYADSTSAMYGINVGSIASNMIYNQSAKIYNETDTIYNYSNSGTIVQANQGMFLTDSLYVLGNNASNIKWILANDGAGQAVWTNPTLLPGGGGAWSSNGTETTLNTITDKVGIGTTTPIGALHLVTDQNNVGLVPELSIERYDNVFPSGRALLHFKRARGAQGLPQIVQSGDDIGGIMGLPYDGSNFLYRAGIRFVVDGTASVGNIPASMIFSTSDGPGLASDRMIINNLGNVGIGTSLPSEMLHIKSTVRLLTSAFRHGLSHIIYLLTSKTDFGRCVAVWTICTFYIVLFKIE
jgi:hypothetical protein